MSTLNATLECRAFDPAEVHVSLVEGMEQLSRPYAFRVDLLAKPGVQLDETSLIGQRAVLVLDVGGAILRRVHGLLTLVETGLHAESGEVAWTVTLEPRFQALALTETTEVVQSLSVPEIIASRLERAGLKEAEDFELQLTSSYPVRDFAVQYRERDLDHVQRLSEHEGITYYFRQDDEKDVVVFIDHNSALRTEADGAHLRFHPRGEHVDVYELSRTTKVVSAKVQVRDYNYRTPDVDLSAEAIAAPGAGVTYQYGIHAKTKDEAQRIATVRAEEIAWQRSVFRGRCASPKLSPGLKFKLESHPLGDLELLIVEVEHKLVQSAGMGGSGTNENRYEGRFVAIPADCSFRPLRRTPKPVVAGVLTGIVEAEQRGEYAELDGDGRYHVRFMFDQGEAQRGKASRPIRMAQPHAGPGYGHHFPLRDGVEVILSCVDGDPDRPIISGAVPNPTTPSTVSSKNAPRNVIRTGGGTEINIDDTDGSERLKISVPFADTILQLGAPNLPHSGIAATTKAKINLKSGEGNDTCDEVYVRSKAPEIVAHGTTSATLQGDSEVTLKSDAKATITAPLVQSDASSIIVARAPSIVANADAVWSATAGSMAVLHGGATVTIQAGGVITVSAPSVTLSGDIVVVKGSASVDIEAPTVNVKAATTNVAGGTVNIDGGVVSITGGPIKLNA